MKPWDRTRPYYGPHREPVYACGLGTTRFGNPLKHRECAGLPANVCRRRFGPRRETPRIAP